MSALGKKEDKDTKAFNTRLDSEFNLLCVHDEGKKIRVKVRVVDKIHLFLMEETSLRYSVSVVLFHLSGRKKGLKPPYLVLGTSRLKVREPE